ncbi:MAG: hypothetical protein ACM31C_14800 [Acidobacteriota bacterium]
MRRFQLVLVLVLVLDLAASAAPLVTPPAGWNGGADPELVQITGGAGHLGGQHGIVEAESYKPATPGIVLDVARISVTTSTPASAARAELDALKDPKVSPDAAAKMIVATAEQTTPVHQQTRVVLVATKDKIVELQGDCIAGDAAVQGWDACVAALQSMDTGVAPADRVELALAGGSGTSTSSSNSSVMSDGSRVPLPPIVVKQESPATDKRPFFIGAGILLLAVVFWWNRRRRERFAQEDRGDAPKEYQ